MTNLAFGVLGLLCLKFRDGFWTATILGYGIFLEGAACVHLHEILNSANWSPNNAGPIFVADVFFPIFLLCLLALAKFGCRTEEEPGLVSEKSKSGTRRCPAFLP
jgi:hypothetical protein